VYIPAGFKDNSVNKKEKKKTEAEVDGSCRNCCHLATTDASHDKLPARVT